MKDESAVFFGGRDWGSVADDLSRIPLDDRPMFVFSLFMITLADQCVFTYNQDAYAAWRSQTRYPKFGWSGFGPHHQNPLKVLWAPERERLIDCDKVVELMPGFTRFFLAEARGYFSRHEDTVDPETFFQAVKRDEAFSFDEGRNVQSFKAEFAKQTALE
jgi:hypothetical protein